MYIILALVQLPSQVFEIGVLWYEVHVTVDLGDIPCFKMQRAEKSVSSRIIKGDVLKSSCCCVNVPFLKKAISVAPH